MVFRHAVAACLSHWAVAQQAGIADLLAGATPAITENFKYTYTLVDTVEAIAKVSTLVMQGADGYEIKDTLANITAAADSIVKSAKAVTVTDLGDDGITVTEIDNSVAGSDTGFVSAADDLTKPWATTKDNNDLLVATNDKAIDFDDLSGKMEPDALNYFADILTGAENILEGGLGDDTLVGKDGAKDVFLFNSWTADEASNKIGGAQLGQDTIYNFEIGTDKLMVHESMDGKDITADNVKDYVSFDAVENGTKITIAQSFFVGNPGDSSEALTITLVGVDVTDENVADLFAFAPAE